jgi:predicted nucleotidyltransferase
LSAVVEATGPNLEIGNISCYLHDMKRDEALSRLRSHEVGLRQLGIERLYLFGSTARGEASDDSDIDLFFDHRKGALGLFELMDVMDRASGILGRKADIMSRASIHPGLKGRIEQSAIRVF